MNVNKRNVKPKKPEQKRCECCGKKYSLTSFYKSTNKNDELETVKWCKNCIIQNSVISTGEISPMQFKETLRIINKPYFKDVLDSAYTEYRRTHKMLTEEEARMHGKEIIGKYFRIICGQKQVRDMTFRDSEDLHFYKNPMNRDERLQEGDRFLKDDFTIKSNDEFKLTDEIINLFGEGFPVEEYRRMDKKYKELTKDRPLQSNLDKETLVAYVRFKVKEEMATAKGDTASAVKWYNAAMDAAKEGILTPKSISSSDLKNGVSSLSEIFKAVEEAEDIIPILPQFKYQPNDAVDFIIWNFVNYIQDVLGKPQCSYEEIYKFYDRKKEEHIKQYGDINHIFDNDTTEENREKVKQFITLPNDY